ncbi:MAG: dockerin type I repeat-containing protein [Planctomycetota bacterium]
MPRSLTSSMTSPRHRPLYPSGYARTVVLSLLVVFAASLAGTAQAQTVLVYDGNTNNSNAVAAATAFGLPTTIVANDAGFIAELTGGTWDLVVVDVPSGIPFTDVGVGTALDAHVAAGGKAMLCWWSLDGGSLDPLAAQIRATFQVESAVDFFVVMPTFAWDSTHPIFLEPNLIPLPLTPATDFWADNGDRLTGAPGTVEIGGFVATPTPGEASIVIGNGGSTIANGFMFDDYATADIVPFLVNEMNFLLFGQGPTFSRGDVNDDGVFDVSDAVFALASLFILASPQPTCPDSADANDDGVFDVSDVVFSLAALFIPGSDPPPDPVTCGVDASDSDALDCPVYDSCP